MKDGFKLLIVSSSETKNQEEERLLSLADRIYASKEYELYSVAVEEIKLMYAELAATQHEKPDVGEANYLKPEESELLEETIWGESVYRVEPGTALLDTTFQNDELLNLSYWVKVDPKEELFPNKAYKIEGELVQSGMIGASPNLLNGWLLVSEDIKTQAGKHHEFLVTARDGSIGRVMLRNANDTIINTEESGRRFLNNVPIP